MERKIKGYIFDLDGTLIDSLDAWVNIGKRYLKGKYIEADDALDNIMKNMSFKEGATYIKETYHLSDSVEDILQGLYLLVEKRYENDVQLYDGVQEFLEKCHQKGYTMCVLTASSSRLAKKALERLGVIKYFDHIYSCQTIGYTKRQPEVYLEVIKRMKLKPNQCVVVEDALYAIQTASSIQLQVKAIQNQDNQKDWKTICQLTEYVYISFRDMEESFH